VNVAAARVDEALPGGTHESGVIEYRDRVHSGIGSTPSDAAHNPRRGRVEVVDVGERLLGRP
jgi:hypothetical protein